MHFEINLCRMRPRIIIEQITYYHRYNIWSQEKVVIWRNQESRNQDGDYNVWAIWFLIVNDHILFIFLAFTDYERDMWPLS